MHWPGVELAIYQSQVLRPNRMNYALLIVVENYLKESVSSVSGSSFDIQMHLELKDNVPPPMLCKTKKH